MKNLFLLAALALTISTSAQTIDEKPIYIRAVGPTLTIDVLSPDHDPIYVGYQDCDYQYIVHIESFLCSNIDSTLTLFSEALRVLELPKTGRDEHIRHRVDGVPMVRYGFAQKQVYIGSPSFMIKGKELTKIIESINEYKSK